MCDVAMVIKCMHRMVKEMLSTAGLAGVAVGYCCFHAVFRHEITT